MWQSKLEHSIYKMGKSLPQLSKVSVINCGLHSLPRSLVTLCHITTLSLENNKLDRLPEGIFLGRLKVNMLPYKFAQN